MSWNYRFWWSQNEPSWLEDKRLTPKSNKHPSLHYFWQLVCYNKKFGYQDSTGFFNSTFKGYRAASQLNQY